MTPRERVGSTPYRLLRSIALMAVLAVAIELSVVKFHAPIRTAVALLIAFVAFGSYLEWNDRRQGRNK